MDNSYTDEKIDYTEYLKHKPQETDPVKLAAMEAAVTQALTEKGVHGQISCTCYADGAVRVAVNGEYYNVFNFNTGRFFSGSVGD